MRRILLLGFAILVAGVLVTAAYQFNTSKNHAVTSANKPGAVIAAPSKPAGDPAEQDAIESLKIR